MPISEFEYKMVQLPYTLWKDPGDPSFAATVMQGLVDYETMEGWDFFRVDPMFTEESAGCLGGLFGPATITRSVNVVTFRRKRK